MVLCGSTNKRFVMNLQKHNLLAVGLSGCDGNLLQVQPVGAEIGYVGEVSDVETALLKELINMNYIPVIAPIGIHGNEVYNINADSCGWDFAISAKELILLQM